MRIARVGTALVAALCACSSSGGTIPSGSGGSTDGGRDTPAVGGAMSTGGAGGLGGSGGKIGGTGGTAATSGGGGGGTGGAGGTGDSGGVAGTPGTGGSALTCSGTLGQPTAPVIVAATLQCNDTLGGISQVSVGAGSATSGFVALLGDVGVVPGFFFDISPSAVQVQQVPSGDAIGLPTNASGAFGVMTSGVDRGSVSWSSRSGTGTGQLTAILGHGHDVFVQLH